MIGAIVTAVAAMGLTPMLLLCNGELTTEQVKEWKDRVQNWLLCGGSRRGREQEPRSIPLFKEEEPKTDRVTSTSASSVGREARSTTNITQPREMQQPEATTPTESTAAASGEQGQKVSKAALPADVVSENERQQEVVNTAEDSSTPEPEAQQTTVTEEKADADPPNQFDPDEFLLLNMPSEDEALKVFDELDDNHDQILSFYEMGIALKRFFPDVAHKANVTRARNAADDDGDGMLRRDEFEAFVRYAVYYNNAWDAFSDEVNDELGKHVSKIDKDAFRRIASARFGLEGDPDELFDLIDDNSSLFVTYDEFCTWMARNSCVWHLVGESKNDV